MHFNDFCALIVQTLAYFIGTVFVYSGTGGAAALLPIRWRGTALDQCLSRVLGPVVGSNGSGARSSPSSGRHQRRSAEFGEESGDSRPTCRNDPTIRFAGTPVKWVELLVPLNAFNGARRWGRGFEFRPLRLTSPIERWTAKR